LHAARGPDTEVGEQADDLVVHVHEEVHDLHLLGDQYGRKKRRNSETVGWSRRTPS
jgi:hypothetical protein